ncbi:MAG: adenosine kinase [Pseudomonadota bacterium]
MQQNNKQYDVVAYGNALVDILVQVNNYEIIEKYNMQKGSMQLISADELAGYSILFTNNTQKSGGSAANTATAIASLGGNVGFIGKVTNDELGQFFIDDLAKANVTFNAKFSDEHTEVTGCSLIIITPDNDRTMNSYLGIAPFIEQSDIDEAMIKNSKVNYFEGYLWDKQTTKQSIEFAMDLAKKHDKQVAFSLSDPFCVERHRDEFRDLINKYVDIVFSNKDEALQLFDCNNIQDAIDGYRQITEIAIITLGAEGSIIISQTDVINIAAPNDLNVIDTTGAGDIYAGGFLYGYITANKSLQESGEIASQQAAKIIQKIGGRL